MISQDDRMYKMIYRAQMRWQHCDNMLNAKKSNKTLECPAPLNATVWLWG
jgi:hypothetical protein